MEYLKNFIAIVCNILTLAICLKVILSWTKINPENKFNRTVSEITNPILNPLKRFIPPMGMLDISPIVAIFALEIVKQLVTGIIK